MKQNELGRSMVEMLGVLAIVGVLSAGALAGYSKAMQMHKMNRFTDDFNYFLGHALTFSVDSSTNPNAEGDLDFSRAAQSLGLLNGALSLHGDKIYDVFQNFFQFYYVASQDGHYRIRYQLTNSEHTQRLCEQLLKIGQSYSQNLSAVTVYNFDGGLQSSRSVKGDSFCNGADCLSKIGLKEMNELCSSCTTVKCYFYFFWD